MNQKEIIEKAFIEYYKQVERETGIKVTIRRKVPNMRILKLALSIAEEENNSKRKGD